MPMPICPNCSRAIEFNPQLNKRLGYLAYQHKESGIYDQNGRNQGNETLEFFCPLCGALVATREADALDFINKRMSQITP